jgi:hypothetical protein
LLYSKAEIKAIKDDIIECKASIREQAPGAERLAIQQRLVKLEERLLNFENDLRNFKDKSKGICNVKIVFHIIILIQIQNYVKMLN